MSPQLRGMHFKAPQQQRGAIGLMAALTLGMVLLFMLLVVDSGRLYFEQRKLQRVADMAALEAVTRGGSCSAGTATTYVNASATRNNFTPGGAQKISPTCGTLVTGTDNLRTFKADANQSSAIRVIATTTVPTSVAGGLWNLLTKQGIDLDTQLTASAVAASPKGLLAQLTIKNTIITVTSSQSALLNIVWGGLLGGTLNIGVGGYQGLVDSQINLLNYLDQLAVDLKLNAGGYNDVLNTNLQLTKLIDTAITVLTANGTTTSIAVDGLTKLKLIAGSTQVKLADILKLQTGAMNSGLDANINIFQLAEAFVQLANKNNGISASIPVNIPNLINGGVKIKIIEPPQLSAIGDPAKAKANPTLTGSQIYVRTAQVRVGASLSLPVLDNPLINGALDQLVGPLSDTLTNLLSLNLAGTLKSVLCLVFSCEQTSLRIFSDSKTISAVIEIGSADSHVTDYSCSSTSSKSLTAQTNASLIKVKVGSVADMDSAFSSTADVKVNPLTIVDIGAITCTGLVLKNCDPKTRKPFYGGGIGLKIDTTIGSLTTNPDPHIYLQPPDVKLQPLYFPQKTEQLVGSLKSTLAGIQIQAYKPTGSSVLGDLLVGVGDILNGLTTALGNLLSSLLSQIVDPILDNLLKFLGIDLNNVEVGANLTCGQGGRAQLVL